MPSPKKPGNKPVQPMEADSEERMECEGSPADESDMIIGSPAPSEQPESEEASSSTETGQSLPSVVVSPSTGSTQSDLQDACSSARSEVSAAGTLSPVSCPPKGIMGCIMRTGRKSSPDKGGADSSSGEATVVSPKSKGKSRTPKKGEKSPRQPVSPGQGATLSPEAVNESEEGAAKRASPMKGGKPGFFRRLLSPRKDTKGDQSIAGSQDYHKDSEQAEDAPLTAVVSPKGTEKVKKSLLERFGIRLKTEREKAIEKENREYLVAKVDEKVNPEDASDCTVSTSLSPSSSTSERRGDENIYFETNFPAPGAEPDETKASVEETPVSAPESTGDCSKPGTASEEPPVDEPEAEATEAATE